MMQQNQKITLLKQLIADVETHIGRKVSSPTDFQLLIDALPKDTPLSMSTLKRLWQYVPSGHVARESTLTILARLVGYEDWQHYSMAHREASESDFLTAINTLRDIPEESIVTLEWMPDRSCTLRMGANGHFRVLAALNTKLQPGDEFVSSWLEKGKPLLATHFTRNGQPQPDYVAGRHHGLTSLTLHT